MHEPDDFDPYVKHASRWWEVWHILLLLIAMGLLTWIFKPVLMHLYGP